MQEIRPFGRLSWRDPGGFVVKFQSRILRAVAPQKAEQLTSLLRERWFVKLTQDGLLPETLEVGPPELEHADQWAWFEHSVLEFPCYPHEITALQLFDAALLTLKVAIEAVQHGWILKDASAWNVLYSRGRPVFVDQLSFEPAEATGNWLGYGQFVRHFLLPLLLHRELGITPADVFLGARDGITPERAFRLLQGLQRASLVALEFVVLPKFLAHSGGRMLKAQQTRRPRTFDRDMARDLLLRTMRRLQRKLETLRPDWRASRSTWQRYEEERAHYSDADLAAKKEFVRKAVAGSTTVLDLGCNAGEFSLLAVECGCDVVAADFDHPALTRLYSRVRGAGTAITPILLDIGRPTPAVGWENREVSSFIDRAIGQFDCILVLGLMHHLLVSERATLGMLAELFDRLNPKRLLVEWVDPKDEKFQQLASINQALYSGLDAAAMEACLGSGFRLISKLILPCGTRVMYLWSR
jgi:SAM-dependent methyltransferase